MRIKDLENLEKLEELIFPSIRDYLDIDNIWTLIRLGKGNIQQIIEKYGLELSYIRNEIKRRKEYYKLLKGKSGEDIESSQKYNNLTSPLGNIIKGSKNFEKCKYCEYYITPPLFIDTSYCKLLDRTSFNTERRPTDDCILKKFTRENFKKLEKEYQSILQELKIKKIEEIEEIKTDTKKNTIIQELKKLASKLEHRPYLPQLRPDNLFKNEDRVIVYLENRIDVIDLGNEIIFFSDGAEMLKKNKFTNATIVGRYYEDEEYLVFNADEKWHIYEGEFGETYGLEWFYSPRIIPKNEWEYFEKNPLYLKLWLELSYPSPSLQFKDSISKFFLGFPL